MNKTIFMFVILTVTSLISMTMANSYFSTDEYQSLPADTKLNLLWAKISENQTSIGFYPKEIVSNVATEDLHPSFELVSDVFTNGRLKLIHTVGNVAQAEFTAEEDSPYTGIFKGSSKILIRFSTAGQPDPTKPKAAQAYKNFAPSIALKFLRDGIPSANLVAMFSLDGQPSWNTFKNDFNTSIPIGDDSTAFNKIVFPAFAKVTPYIASVGLTDAAKYDTLGKIEENIKFPFKLIFRPNPELSQRYTDDFQEIMFEQLKKIEVGTTLYEVMAMDEPGCPLIKIGQLKINTKLITSAFGDDSLFFQHGLVDNEDKPRNWGKYRDSFNVTTKTTRGLKGKCPYYTKFLTYFE